MAGPPYTMRHFMDNSSLLECYLSTGQRSMSPVLVARHRCLWHQNEGHVEVVRLLLEYGADPSACDKSGVSPSQVASRKGHQQIVQLLSEYAAKSVKEYYPDDLAVTILPCL